MKTQIVVFPIYNELDIVLVHRRVVQLCELTGLSISDKTRFATAISEICRNCIEYAKNGTSEFYIDESNGNYSLEAAIYDEGPGIKDLDLILKRERVPAGMRGVGIHNSKKLVDFFNIITSPAGTRVIMGMKVPLKHPPINTTIIKGWIEHFKKNVPVSPYEEIKKQNIQLLDLAEQLKLKNLEAEKQIDEIKELNGQLKRANKELEDFTYTVSHDLKSPINNIEVLVAFLKKSNDETKTKTFVEAIDTSIRKLKNTIHGLVEIIESQNTEKEVIKNVFFQDIFNSINDQYHSEIEEDVVLKSDFAGYSTIKYYEAYVHSIMQNLINNSLKYRSDLRPLSIEVSTEKVEDFCLLKVKDNGIGMNMERVGKNLFKPFMRFNTSKEGRGIGLHLVRSMVERNGGKLEVESQVEQGTTFKIYLKGY